jgi:hypothetical protein
MMNAQDRKLSTADFAAVADAPAREVDAEAREPRNGPVDRPDEPRGDSRHEALAPLFAPDTAGGFRSRWDEVQSAFVDDPRQAVRDADELVAQVMKSLAETFASERSRLEGELQQTDKGSTENLRLALQRYRSFFQRLLSL